MTKPPTISSTVVLLLCTIVLLYTYDDQNHGATSNMSNIGSILPVATAIHIRQPSVLPATQTLKERNNHHTATTTNAEGSEGGRGFFKEAQPLIDDTTRTPSSSSSSSVFQIPPGGDAETSPKSTTGGTASFASSVFNLANNVAGAGLLTLAAGKATSRTGLVPSIVICVGLAFLSGRTFTLVGKACELTGETTFKGLWGYAFGSSKSHIVDSIIFIQCFISSTIYVGLLGDIFSALLGPTPLPPQLKSRTSVILLLACTTLFPLNLIKNLSALAFTSILGLISVIYTVSFIIYRSLDGSYSPLTQPMGKFLVDNTIIKPSFLHTSMFNLDLRSLVLISNLGLAFIAHYNAPTYFREMKNPTQNASFPKMVYLSYSILALIYAATMTAGYATFGDNALGNLLLSYHSTDKLAFLGRVATGMSVVFGFPLVSAGAREGLKNASSALGYPSVSKAENHSKVVIGMLAASCFLAIQITDIKVIAGFSGASMGSFLVYVCPTLVYIKVLERVYGRESGEYKNGFRWNAAFVPFGIFLGVMGVTMNYKSLMETVRVDKIMEVVGQVVVDAGAAVVDVNASVNVSE